MRILFAVRHNGYLRPFAPTLEILVERGHEIVVAVGWHGRRGNGAADRLAEELARHPRISFVHGAGGKPDRDDVGMHLRQWMNYLRYLEPPLDTASPRLRGRAARALPAAIVDGELAATAADPAHPAKRTAYLADVEARLPGNPAARELIERVAPDIVTVTPLIERHEPQLAYLRAAAQLGIPRAVLVTSWDNMTTGGLLHDVPDRVIVWNDAQRREAVGLMDIPYERVVITGAPGFDVWFDRPPARDRSTFCSSAGLPDDAPYILYLGSSGFIAPEESRFITAWLEGLRSSKDERLQAANVVIRQHPFNPVTRDPRLAELVATDARAVIHPSEGTVVATEPTRSDYFDSLHHAAVVVGINTSGLIEAAIVGRPVLVPRVKRFRDAQELSPHFRYLLEEAGGLIEPMRFKRHYRALATTLDEGLADGDAERARRFLHAFVRPFGLTEPASPRVADAIEQLAALEVVAVPPPDPPDPEIVGHLEEQLGLGRFEPERNAPAATPAPAGEVIAAELREALLKRQQAPVPVNCPLMLIGQLQRSGGTLLNTLLDGHPMLHTHPYELQIGHPTKHDWPQLDLQATPEEWLEALSEPRLERLFREGYQKTHRRLRGHQFYQPLPFLLPPSLLSSLFLATVNQTPPTGRRQILDRYFTAFFNAWLDHGVAQNVPPRRWITAFGPRLGWEPSRSSFFSDYPDGRLAFIVRDPRAWFLSASTHSKRYGDLDDALDMWLRNAQEVEAAKAERPAQVLVTTYDALAVRTERTMRALAEWLDLEWDPILLSPTFNRQRVRANTSHEPAATGVVTTSVERWRKDLPAAAVAEIEARALDTYEHLRDQVADIA